MKIIFLGATKFSEAMLQHLLVNNIPVEKIFTIPQDFSISYSDKKVKNYNYADLAAIGSKEGISCEIVESGSGKTLGDYYDMIKAIDPDVILVMGWYYMVPARIRSLAKQGAWGIHASLLPDYAGGAPLVWSIIEGNKKTGVSLFRLADGVDDGDIIEQAEIEIAENDTIKEVYDKAIDASREILVKSLLNPDKIQYKPQDKTKIKVYPQRKPEDGQIDPNWPAEKMYNFIRAQSPPYPGAFLKTSDNRKIYIDKARLSD